uniref:Cyclin J n=1 Tax=Nothobranchius kuhntae TaxID=321403 RepID=A0A1A8JZE9_NOTKU
MFALQCRALTHSYVLSFSLSDPLINHALIQKSQSQEVKPRNNDNPYFTLKASAKQNPADRFTRNFCCGPVHIERILAAERLLCHAPCLTREIEKISRVYALRH